MLRAVLGLAMLFAGGASAAESSFEAASLPFAENPAIRCGGYLNGYIRVDGEAKVPALKSCSSPKYSDASRRAGHQGGVTVEATVRGDGRVASTRLYGDGSRADDLDKAALDAIARWTFDPARNSRGEPMQAAVIASVAFWKDDVNTVRDKTCADFVTDARWFAETFPQVKRTRMHLFEILVQRLAMDMIAAHETREAATALGRRLPAAMDTAYDKCSSMPAANFLLTLREALAAGQ